MLFEQLLREIALKFLIVDNSRAMRRIVSRTIRQAGYEDATFLEAENGRDAMELAVSESPDFILSDWNMPEMTGIEFLNKLKADELKIPFGFVTSQSTPAMIAEATDGGALFLLVKPFSAEDMNQVLSVVVPT
ncbi:MAG: two-component system chemotaxis response regulator CheY [Candidatus Krumholzibacteriia bacterium]